MSTPARPDLFWASAVSEKLDTQDAVREAAEAIRAARGASASDAGPPDLILVFPSVHHARAYAQLPRLVHEELGPGTLIGASAAGAISGERELEGREALVLTAAWLPEARISAHHFGAPPGDGSLSAWASAMSIRENDPRSALVLADPATCDTEELLRMLDTVLPSSSKAGGHASGTGSQPAVTFAGDRAHRGGAVVCLFEGAFEMHTVVAQGCRPIGQPYIVTRARGNVITELNAGKPTEVLRKLYESLSGRDLTLFQDSLALGLASPSDTDAHAHGEFLVRSVIGIDRDSGALAVQGRVQSYQVVQFHLRDREAAAQDLSQQLRRLAFSDVGPRIRGGLLFSSTSRGERMFGVPHHDSSAYVQRVSPTSLSGLFCGGEIGPLRGRTCLHGFSSVYAVFAER